MSVKLEIETILEQSPVDKWAVIPASVFPQEESRMKVWLEEGYQGSMSYLERHLDMKFNPEKIMAGTRSILVCLMNYYLKRPAETSETEANVAIYSHGEDYHQVFKNELLNISSELKKIFPNEKFRVFTDTAPLNERFYAQQAGLGFTGKNGLLINRDLGSWFFIGEILTTAHLPEIKRDYIGHCPSGCTRCRDICPTNALDIPYLLKANRCISYQTIEEKGFHQDELWKENRDWAFGCDLCQKVCPFNYRAEETSMKAFKEAVLGFSVDIHDEIARFTSLPDKEKRELLFRELYGKTPLFRSGLLNWLRNLLERGLMKCPEKIKPLIHEIRMLGEETLDSLCDEIKKK